MLGSSSRTEDADDEMSCETMVKDDILMLDDVDFDAEFLEDCFDPTYSIRRKSVEGCVSNTTPESEHLPTNDYTQKQSITTPESELLPTIDYTQKQSNRYSMLDPEHSFTPDIFSSDDDINGDITECAGTDQLGEQATFSKNKEIHPESNVSKDSEFQVKYNRALNNLASSMQRSQLSRAEILSRRDNPSSSINNSSLAQPSPQALSGLARLLSGRSSTLTVALQQSRKQLKSYMDLMYTNEQI